METTATTEITEIQNLSSLSSKSFKDFFNKPENGAIPGNSLRFRTSSGKGGWLTVWIKPKVTSSHLEPLCYLYEFPLKLRQSLLLAIYGDKCRVWPSFERGNAGNINPHSLAFTVRDWEKATELLKEKEIN